MSVDVIYTSGGGGGRAFLPLALICLLTWSITPISAGLADEVSCCPNGTTWRNSTECTDGSSIRLNCQSGMFLLDSEANDFDRFTLVESDGSIWLDHTGDRIAPDRFCILDLGAEKERYALLCFEEDSQYYEWRNALFCILSIVSAIFLIATLAVYIILPELREIQDKAMMAAVTSLAVSYIVLSIQHVRIHEDGDEVICLSLAFLLYYGFMSTFFWLNVVAFNIWRSVWFKNFGVKDKPLFGIYCAIGWLAPACFMIAALVTHFIEGDHLRPRFGEHTCWFGGTLEMWAYFYGPIAVLLALNIIYLGLTSWRLWLEYREDSGSKLRALRFKCILYFKLILVMGITWIFEVLSFAAGTRNNDYWIPTDILNALQGLVIFLLLVATRKRVRKLLAKKRPCGIGFPKSWVAYEDEECEDILPEELELSQQA